MITLRLRVGMLMRERGMDSRDLAAKANIAVATARALALGENARIDIPVLSRVAFALNVSPMMLFEEGEVPTPSDLLTEKSSESQITPLAFAAR